MIKIYRKHISFLFLVALIILGGCQDEVLDRASINKNEDALLKEAKEWYNNAKEGKEVLLNNSSSLKRSKSGGDQLFYTEPSWQYYSISQKGNYTVIDVDLTDRIGLDFVTEEHEEAYQRTGDYKYKRSYSRLVVLINNTTEEKEGFVMTIMPSVRYTDLFHDKINKTTYLNRDLYLDGYVLFHNMDGEFESGLIYEIGQVVGSLETASSISENTIEYKTIPAIYKVNEGPRTKMGGEGGFDGGELPPVTVYPPGNGGGSGGSGGWTGNEGNPLYPPVNPNYPNPNVDPNPPILPPPGWGSGNVPGGSGNSNIYNGYDLTSAVGPLGDDYPWSDLTTEEKIFVINHPREAKSFYDNAKKAATAVASMSGQHNGEADAVRHAYWSALNARDHGSNLAKQYGDAHESNPNQPANEKEMDSFNNAVGYEIGQNGRGNVIIPSATDEQIYNAVIKAKEDGKLQLALKN